MLFNTTILFNGQETEVEVDYSYEGPVRGKMFESNGDPGYPDEGASAEVEAVYLTDDPKQVCIMDQLDTATIEDLFQQAIDLGAEKVIHEAEDAAEDAADRKREAAFDE